MILENEAAICAAECGSSLGFLLGSGNTKQPPSFIQLFCTAATPQEAKCVRKKPLSTLNYRREESNGLPAVALVALFALDESTPSFLQNSRPTQSLILMEPAYQPSQGRESRVLIKT